MATSDPAAVAGSSAPCAMTAPTETIVRARTTARRGTESSGGCRSRRLNSSPPAQPEPLDVDRGFDPADVRTLRLQRPLEFLELGWSEDGSAGPEGLGVHHGGHHPRPAGGQG